MCYNDFPVDRNELQYWVAFGRVPQIGRARFSLLEQHFSSMEEAWEAGPASLQQAGLKGAALSALLAGRDGIVPDEEMERLERANIWPLTWHDDAYPDRLKEIYDKPPLLYVRGELTSSDEWCVALVGLRPPGCRGVGQRPGEQWRDGGKRPGKRHRYHRASSRSRRRRPDHCRSSLRIRYRLSAGEPAASTADYGQRRVD